MAHFARVENNIVQEVLVVPDDQEHRGDLYLKLDLGLGGNWIKTSYNTIGGIHLMNGTPLRKNFAGIGYIYDQVWDAFMPPKPFDSWKLNYETFLWEPPTPMPPKRDGYLWKWAEGNKEWIEVPR